MQTVPASAKDKRAYVASRRIRLWREIQEEAGLQSEPKPAWTAYERNWFYGVSVLVKQGEGLDGYLILADSRSCPTIRVGLPKDGSPAELQSVRDGLIRVLGSVRTRQGAGDSAKLNPNGP